MVVAKSCPTLCDPMDGKARQAPLSMGFSWQAYWSGLPFPPPGELPKPGIKPTSPVASALAGGFFTTESPRKPLTFGTHSIKLHLILAKRLRSESKNG